MRSTAHGICHVTSVHYRGDARILPKMCAHLAQHGYQTTLVVDDGKPGETTADGVRIVAGSGSKNKICRILTAPWRVYRMAVAQNAELYHLHDPELLMIALPLKWHGAKVVFDSHEDIPADIREKKWIPERIRETVAMIYENVEKFVISRVDATISVTPNIVERLGKSARKIAMVTNYPLLAAYPDRGETTDEVVYTGAIQPFWHLDEAVQAVSKTDQRLVIAGKGNEDYAKGLAAKNPDRVEFKGLLSHDEVRALTSRAFAGLSLNEQPRLREAGGTLGVTKIFEYMAAGLPVIMTDYPLWVELLQRWNCGVAVDPHDAKALAEALQRLKDDPELWQTMSETGRRAVAEEFNWSTQQQVLEDLYAQLGVTPRG